jgi:hypothetical protein
MAPEADHHQIRGTSQLAVVIPLDVGVVTGAADDPAAEDGQLLGECFPSLFGDEHGVTVSGGVCRNIMATDAEEIDVGDESH